MSQIRGGSGHSDNGGAFIHTLSKGGQFPLFFGSSGLSLASPAGIFSGARISSLPTNGVCEEGRNASSPKNACGGG